MEQFPLAVAPPTSLPRPPARQKVSWSDHQPRWMVWIDSRNLAALTVRRGDTIRYRVLGDKEWHEAEVIEVEPKYVVVKNYSGSSWRIDKTQLGDEQLYQLTEKRQLERVRLVQRGDHWATEAA